VLLAQQVLLHLAHRVAWQLAFHEHLLGHLEVGDPCARIPNLLWLSSFHYPAPQLNTFGTVMAARSRSEGKGDGPPDHYRRYGFWFLGI